MKQVSNKVNDVQEGIGHGLVASLDAAVIAFNQTTGAMNSNVDVGKVTFQVFSSIAEFASNTAVGIYTLGSTIVWWGSVVAEAFDIVGVALDGDGQKFDDFRASIEENNQSVVDFALNLHDQNEKMSKDWNTITTDAKAYSSTGPAAYQQTAEAAKAAADKVTEANKAIADTAVKLADLVEGREKEVSDTRKSIAEEYVAEQARITQLKIDLSTASTAEERNSLAVQLQENQRAFDSKKSIASDYATEIAEANRRAIETDFERNLEDIARKDIEQTKQFEKKRNVIYQEMALEDQKLASLIGNERSITQTVATESSKRTASVTASIDAQVIQYDRLRLAASSAYSASSSASSGGFVNPNAGYFSIGGASTPAVAKHEAGGFVNAPRGTEVPIIAHGGEEVIPAELAGSSGRGSTVTIVINNPSVRNDDDLTRLRREIEDYMRPLLLNAKIAHA